MIDPPDCELNILEAIRKAQDSADRLTQRNLARVSGLSLGLTNALIRRLADEGLVALVKRSSKDIRYSLTPRGEKRMGGMAAERVAKAAQNADLYRRRFEAFVSEAKNDGATTFVLIGATALEPIIEGVCDEQGLAFVKSADTDRAKSLGKKDGVVLIWTNFAENEPVSAWNVSLASVLAGAARSAIQGQG